MTMRQGATETKKFRVALAWRMVFLIISTKVVIKYQPI